MKVIAACLLAVLCAGGVHGEGRRYNANIPAYSLLKSVEACDIVAISTVATLTGVYRENITDHGRDSICTDVMFRIETLNLPPFFVQRWEKPYNNVIKSLVFTMR